MAPPKKNATYIEGLNNILQQTAGLSALPDADFASCINLQTIIADMIGQATAQQAQKEQAEKQAQLQQSAQQSQQIAGGANHARGMTPGPQPMGGAGMGMNPGTMGGGPNQPNMDEIARMMSAGDGGDNTQ